MKACSTEQAFFIAAGVAARLQQAPGLAESLTKQVSPMRHGKKKMLANQS
jgi:hypothetical protein